MPNDKSSHQIAPEKLRCIWMTAGILSYQLCDRQFDCENCPLDKAMRMNFSPKHKKKLPSERRRHEHHSEEHLFSRDHCWVKRMDKDIMRVGLEPKFAQALIAPKAIALPSVGEAVEPSQYCCWIILEGGTIPIRSPLHGKVYAVNARIFDETHEICQHPMTNGWLFDVQADEQSFETSGLMTEADAEKRFDIDFTRFTSLLNETLGRNNAHVGMTMQDGGIFLSQRDGFPQSVSDIVGQKKYCELLRSVFVTK